MIAYPPEVFAHLLAAMLSACDRLSFEDEGDAGLTSSKLAFRTALAEMLTREQGGIAFAKDRLEEASTLITLAVGRPPDTSEARMAQSVAGVELLTADLLREAEIAVSRQPALPLAEIGQLCLREAEELVSPSGEASEGPPSTDTAITHERLERYLRAHTQEPTLALHELRPLMGGFGKETFFFSASGKSLDGEFVIRRDQPMELVPGACHKVVHEYQVIRAVRAAGFPAPEVLWLEQNSKVLPGPDFIVMRRSEGRPLGTLTGASGAIDPALNDELGLTMGRLHALPPLTDLGDLTESIREEQWGWSGRDVLRTYIAGMRTMLLSSAHSPSLGTVAAWNWLDDNIPENLGGACLIHGDIGFHNMLHNEHGLACLLDWENAQIGHAGMDLGYVFNAAGASLDWPRVMRAYAAAGGQPLPDRTLAYFRIMMNVRVATTVNVGAGKLFSGAVPNLRLLNAEMQFRGAVLKRLAGLIAAYSADYSNELDGHDGGTT